MSRGISSTNLAEINTAHLHEVVLVKLAFDTPVYVHSGIGTISYAGNDYTGVGDFGGVTNAKESESLGPQPLTLTLSGVDSTYISEGLDSGNYGDVVTMYVGYRQDDGALVDDPQLVWQGSYEHASISLGDENGVSITCQHDLAVLGRKHGGRYTDEDQQSRFAGDTGFKSVANVIQQKLNWAGGYGAAGVAPPGPGNEYDEFDNPFPWRN